MNVKTKLGIFDITEKETITFENGIPGFEALKNFSLVSRADTEPIKWLVSIEDENVALPVVDPWLLVSDYSFNLEEEELEMLGGPQKENLLILSVIDLHTENVTVNLMAPIVINLEKAVGIQTVLNDTGYSTRYPVGK